MPLMPLAELVARARLLGRRTYVGGHHGAILPLASRRYLHSGFTTAARSRGRGRPGRWRGHRHLQHLIRRMGRRREPLQGLGPYSTWDRFGPTP